MRRLVAFWAGYWTVNGLFYWIADRRGFALCSAVRHLYGTDNPEGRARLAGSLTLGGVVLYRHLVKPGSSLAGK